MDAIILYEADVGVCLWNDCLFSLATSTDAFNNTTEPDLIDETPSTAKLQTLSVKTSPYRPRGGRNPFVGRHPGPCFFHMQEQIVTNLQSKVVRNPFRAIT